MIQDEIRKSAYNQETTGVLNSQSRRLYLTLVSLLSAVSFQILEPLAQMIGESVRGLVDKELRLSFLEEIKSEIMERVGDEGKQFCLDWWSQLASDLTAS
jgi:hypothetical protein